MSAPYAAPHRSPDELLRSTLSDRCLRAWHGIRSVQGGKPGTEVPATSFTLTYIAERSGLTLNQLSRALQVLIDERWVEVCGFTRTTPHLRCHSPQMPEPEEEGGDDREPPESDGEIPPHSESDSPTQRISFAGGENQIPPHSESVSPVGRISFASGAKPYKEDPVFLSSPSIRTTLKLDGEGGALDERYAPSADKPGRIVFVVGMGEREQPTEPDRSAKNEAFASLRRRGVQREEALTLAATHWPSIPEAVADYDRRREAGTVEGPGWLVRTIPLLGVEPPRRLVIPASPPEPERPPASPDIVAQTMAEINAALLAPKPVKTGHHSAGLRRLSAKAVLADDPQPDLATITFGHALPDAGPEHHHG